MRKDLPTTLEPAPPFFFSIPRLLYFLPEAGLLAHTIQDLMNLPLKVETHLVKNWNLKYTGNRALVKGF
jgi:hypothetical protein